jgi:hypothetical protein
MNDSVPKTTSYFSFFVFPLKIYKSTHINTMTTAINIFAQHTRGPKKQNQTRFFTQSYGKNSTSSGNQNYQSTSM